MKEYIRILDTSADANPTATTTIAPQARAVIKVEGDDQVDEHQHQHHHGGKEEGRSGHLQSPGIGRTAKRRRRGVVKDGSSA